MSEEPTIPSIGTLVRPNENCSQEWVGQLSLVVRYEEARDIYDTPRVWIRRLSDGVEGHLTVPSIPNALDIAGEAPNDG